MRRVFDLVMAMKFLHHDCVSFVARCVLDASIPSVHPMSHVYVVRLLRGVQSDFGCGGGRPGAGARGGACEAPQKGKQTAGLQPRLQLRAKGADFTNYSQHCPPDSP